MSSKLLNLITSSPMRDISISQKSILQIYALLADDRDCAGPSIKEVVEISQLSNRTIQSCIKYLMELNYLILEGEMLSGVRIYCVNLDKLKG